MTFVEPKAVRGQFVEWWASIGELTATKSQKPSQNFVEGIFDALTSYKRFLLTPFSTHPPFSLELFRAVWLSINGALALNGCLIDLQIGANTVGRCAQLCGKVLCREHGWLEIP